MDYLHVFKRQFRIRLAALLLANCLIVIGSWYVSVYVLKFKSDEQGIVLSGSAIVASLMLTALFGSYFVRPIAFIWQAVLHISPTAQKETPAPTLNSAHYGRDLLESLTSQIYQFATVADSVNAQLIKTSNDPRQNFVAVNMPLPLLILGNDRKIIYANKKAGEYLDFKPEDVINSDVYSILDMSFQDESTFDVWLEKSRLSTVTSVNTWENVKVSLQSNNKSLRFDLAAYYNKNNPVGWEVMLILFDHTGRYSSDDQAMGLVAMAVHELRTPLTLLRGYIEALEEDLSNLNAVDSEYLHKMDAAGQQLVTFINNVLNVARISDDQFLIRLHEEKWPAVIETAVMDMRLRAAVHGITLQTDISANLPTVGVDRAGMYEVICNLIDNAIKYSGNGKKIIIHSTLTNEGLVETDVQDFGIGIPGNVVADLFDKYYRSHKSRETVSGTGLGLYLCRTIVKSHGGNIWVRSTEGKGSIFSFTVIPFAQLATELKNHPEDLTRTAHGWIKNHSLYRR